MRGARSSAFCEQAAAFGTRTGGERVLEAGFLEEEEQLL